MVSSERAESAWNRPVESPVDFRNPNRLQLTRRPVELRPRRMRRLNIPPGAFAASGGLHLIPVELEKKYKSAQVNTV